MVSAAVRALIAITTLVLGSSAADARPIAVPCAPLPDGSCDSAPLESAVASAGAGDTIEVAAGRFVLRAPLTIRAQGRPKARIVLRGKKGGASILDAKGIVVSGPAKGDSPPYAQDNGTVQIEGASHVWVDSLTIVNSRQQGLTIRDASHVEVSRVTTDYTFSSGIGVWDTNHDRQGTTQIRIHDCTIRHANHLRLKYSGYVAEEAPHEAISIGGATHFFIENNRVEDGYKEGIDIKETSAHGVVRGNVVDNMDRQGIYVGAWFGALEDVLVERNTVTRCRGAGIVAAVEARQSDNRGITIRDNVVIDNQGTGIWLARFGDGPQADVLITGNTVRGNGFGAPDVGFTRYWITGGIWIHVIWVSGVRIEKNVVEDNAAFAIGWSRTELRTNDRCAAGVRAKSNRTRGGRARAEEQLGWPPQDLVVVDELDEAFFSSCDR